MIALSNLRLRYLLTKVIFNEKIKAASEIREQTSFPLANEVS